MRTNSSCLMHLLRSNCFNVPPLTDHSTWPIEIFWRIVSHISPQEGGSPSRRATLGPRGCTTCCWQLNFTPPSDAKMRKLYGERGRRDSYTCIHMCRVLYAILPIKREYINARGCRIFSFIRSFSFFPLACAVWWWVGENRKLCVYVFPLHHRFPFSFAMLYCKWNFYQGPYT